jgi:CheY-like chemotaxis protein
VAEAKGLRIKTVPGTVMVQTDPVLIERVLRNLIENAIRYTNVGGVLLGVRRRGDHVRVDVFDTGIGVPHDHLPYIFDEFYQVGNQGRNRQHGLGLGLSIVRRIARLLGAELLVTSHEGRGSRFSLLLPQGQATPQSTPVVARTGAEGGRILIVEDDAGVRAGLGILAESWGYTVVTASSGEEALALFSAGGGRFDVVVTDHRLGPGLNGTEAAKEIHKKAGRFIPTLIVTGDTAPERISEVYDSGFDILHKPVATGELRRKLAQLLECPENQASQSAC